jgi:hypothetical protein
VAGIAKELSLAAAPSFDGARGVHRSTGAAGTAERLLLGTTATNEEPTNHDNARNSNRCDDKYVGVHCRLTVELSGARAGV